ncbi:MAG TPA: outer membrane beta-barrel protein [Bacteroidales bacterium]|nr:outer membrane beta-barrel protein [Bacteroidales bacterium]
MKKILITAVIVVFSISAAHSQTASFGLKGGLNFSSISELRTGQSVNYTVSALEDAYTGFHIGVVGFFRLPGFFLQPEFLYTQNGRDMVVIRSATPNVSEHFVQKYSHLTMPVHVGMNLGPIKIGGGPVFNFLLDEWNDLDDISFEQAMNRLTLGYQLGAGLKLGSLIIDFRYEGSFADLGTGVTVGGQTISFDNRPRQYILSLGFLF